MKFAVISPSTAVEGMTSGSYLLIAPVAVKGLKAETVGANRRHWDRRNFIFTN
jgi:hypothetical protein